MGFKSFLSAIGHAPLAVLKYLGSPAGQNTVKVAEAAAVTIGTAVGGPGLGAGIAGIELLVNKGIAAGLSIEANAAVIGAQSGTGAQKGIAVAASVEATAEQLLKDLGYENPTVDQVELITNTVSKSVADILNSVPPPAALVRVVNGSGQVETAKAPAPAEVAAVAAVTTGMQVNR